MKENKHFWIKGIYWFIFAVALIIIYKTLDNFNDIANFIKNFFDVIMPFIVGIIVSYLFYLPSKKLEDFFRKSKNNIVKKKSRTISVILVYLIAFLLLALVIRFIMPTITQSLIDLVNNIQNYYNNTIKNINEMPEGGLLNNDIIKELIKSIAQIDIKQFLNIDRLTEYAKGAINAAFGIFDFFVAMIVSIYILLERSQILEFLKKLTRAIFGRNTSKKIEKYFYKSNNIFFNFLVSQGLDAIVVAVLSSILLSISGVKYAILLGVLIGVSNLIPYFGAIIGVIIAVIITIFTGGISQAVIMAISTIILQQIDANIINPKIVGNSLKISPLLVIFGVSVGGAYFGVLGMFLAVPIIAVLKVLIIDYIEYKAEKNKVREG